MEQEINLALYDMHRFVNFILIYLKREMSNIKNSVFARDLFVYYTFHRRLSESALAKWEKVDDILRFYSPQDSVLMIQNQCNSRLNATFRGLVGAQKALMFKLLMMYINTGVVVDPNVFPKVSLRTLKSVDPTVYISLSKTNEINVMMMANTSNRRSLLFLTLFLAFVLEIKKDTVINECSFLYEKLTYSIGTNVLQCNDSRQVKEVRYKIQVDPSRTNTKSIDLVWFPDDEIYHIEPHIIKCDERMQYCFEIDDSKLIVTSSKPWTTTFYVDIVFRTDEVLYALCEEVQESTQYYIKRDEEVLVHCDITDFSC